MLHVSVTSRPWSNAALIVSLLAALVSVPTQATMLESYDFVPLTGQPTDVVYDAARNVAYVSNRSLDQVDVISLTSLTVEDPFAVSAFPMGMALTPDGTQLLVASRDAVVIDVVGLPSGVVARSIDVSADIGTWVNIHKPLRIHYDSAGRCFWNTQSTGGPHGFAFQLDLTTDTSTQAMDAEGLDFTVRIESSEDKSKLLVFSYTTAAAVYDAATGVLSTPVYIPEMGTGHGGWIRQGYISDDGQTILLTRSTNSTHVYDGSFVHQGSLTTIMAWAAMKPGSVNEVIIVEGEYSEGGSNRISVHHTQAIEIIETLALPERIGMNEYDTGTKPIALLPDGNTLLAVGQTGLYVIDTSGRAGPIPGDADEDGDVDLDDFLWLKIYFGDAGDDITWTHGDFDRDKDVDLDDFSILKQNFGATTTP